MAKRKSPAPVTFNKQAFLLPKMEVTEYGFYVRELSGRSLFDLKEMSEKLGKDIDADSVDVLMFFMLKGTCDSAGRPVFTEEDLPLLADKSPVLLKDVAMKALKLSGVPESILAGFDEATDNLKNDQPSSSFTELPTNSVSL